MTFIPSLSASLIAFSVLALLALANWYVSGFSLEPRSTHGPGEDRKGDFGECNADEADEFKRVA